MRIITPPVMEYIDVINACVTSIDSHDLKSRVDEIVSVLLRVGVEYCDKAENCLLNELPIFHGKDNDVVMNRVTKKELKGLYTDHMVPSYKPARIYYDKIKLSANLGICPFCGFGHVNTLDHYLPKSKFPLVSILPINLVPCCADCNKGKTSRVAVEPSELSLHPYFNDQRFISQQWLFATVKHTNPVVIDYYVNAPFEWGVVLSERAKNHFQDFRLKTRYAVQAGNELASLVHELNIDYEISGSEGVRRSLEKKALASLMQERNSWRTAMYQALSEDEWFYSEGFMIR